MLHFEFYIHSMIYFLHGPNTYASRRKLLDIIASFRERAGGALGLTRIDAEEEPSAVIGVGRGASLFSPKELVVIERISSAGEAAGEYVSRRLSAWSSDRALTVVFWEADLDSAHHALLDAIETHSPKAQSFPLLSPASASRWLVEEARRRGLKLAADEQRAVLQTHGSDLWALSNELEKIRDGWSVRAERRAAGAVWDFTDAFIARRRSAFVPLTRLLEAGFEPVQLLAALGAALRTVALVRRELEGGKAGALTAKLHPYAVRKATALARNIDGATLQRWFGELMGADIEFKTGRLPFPLPLVKLTLR